MSLFEDISRDMLAAMKARDADRLSALRMLVSAVKYGAIDNKDGLSDEKVIAVLRGEAKKRREAIEAYSKAGREDARAKEQAELELIDGYLPKLMNEDEVRKIIDEIVASGNYPNFGALMGAVMGKLKGKADGGLVSQIAKDIFEKK